VSETDREEAKFYTRLMKGLGFVPTPSWVTSALLAHETFSGTTLEPACGEGHIAKLLPPPVYASDVWDHGYAAAEVRNFFHIEEPYDNVVTNPPFGQQQAFKRHALRVARKKVALLWYVKHVGAELESPTSRWLATVYIVGKVNFPGLALNLKFAWFVWDKTRQGHKASVIFRTV
jgi:hypothetical protein